MKFDFQGIKGVLEPHFDEKKAAGAKAYMKNKFAFLGIQRPLRNELLKPLFPLVKTATHEEIVSLTNALWKANEREYQYLAIDILIKSKSWMNKSSIVVFEKMVLAKSWWDSVDMIAARLIGNYFLIYPEKRDQYLEKWYASGNVWLHRCCIIFQLNYQEKTDSEILASFCDSFKNSKEFFIQKAIGWSLRQYAKTNPNWVREFVQSHELKPLSKREALKHLGN